MLILHSFFKKISQLTRLMDPLLGILLILCSGYGFLLIASATNSFGTHKNLIVQIASFLVGIVGIYLIMLIDVENLSKLSVPLYILCIGMLCATLLFGKEVMGNKNWIDIGPINIQPSEIVKLGFIITFATHLKKVESYINRPSALLPLAIHFGIILVLVLMQGDLGTALVFLFIFIIMMFAAGLHSLYFIVGGIALVAAAPFIFECILKEYQRLRILAVYDPSIDPLGYGYHTIQSKITLGSGGMFGSGLFNGIQTQYSILPEKQTDFIFSVAGEELGFVGVFFIIALLVAMIIRCTYIAHRSSGSLESYVASGVTAMLFFQAAENIGMCIGVLPVIGITLPFFSYGGSSMLTSTLAIGLMMNVNSKRKQLGLFQSSQLYNNKIGLWRG